MSGRVVAGFGFSSKATSDSLASALEAVCGQTRVEALATLADKAERLRALGQEMGVEIIEVIGPLPDTVTNSHRSKAERGTGSVAEACALAAAGPGAYLLATRKISADRLATCALAQAANQGDAT